MSDFLNDPTGLRRAGNSRFTGRTALMLLGLLALMLLGAGAWSHFSGKRSAAPASEPTSTPKEGETAAPQATIEAEKVERTPEEKAEDEAEEARILLEPQVRADMCQDYGERYVAARTGVELVRAVQLSQAAGCGWEAMLHADAATHRFVPEALAVAKRMEAEEVETGASTSSDDADLLEDMNKRIERIESTTDDIRRRIR